MSYEYRSSCVHIRAILLVSLTILVLVLLGACTRSQKDEQPGDHATPAAIDAFVTITPQAYLAQRIAGERADIHTLVPRGQSPHTYSPSPSQLEKLSRADVYFRIGVEIEQSIREKITTLVPDMPVVDTRRGVSLLTLQEHTHGNGHDHDHSPGTHDTHTHPAKGSPHASFAGDRKTPHDHHHGPHGDVHGARPDPHIWLDPLRAVTVARTMCSTFVALDSAHATRYRRNLDSLVADLDSLDRFLHTALAPVKGKTLLVFHPAFGYFADRYGLVQRAVRFEGKTPGARRLAALIDEAHTHDIPVMFVEPRFPEETARQIARQIDAALVTIDPLAYDYIDNLSRIGTTVAQALADSSS
jgi:zinc transport system substrate-binding protein